LPAGDPGQVEYLQVKLREIDIPVKRERLTTRAELPPGDTACPTMGKMHRTKTGDRATLD
jgi:hypothetical protein